MYVYVVTFKSTGETWHTAICANNNAVASVCKNHGIDTRTHGKLEDDNRIFASSKDPSQTAIVRLTKVIER